MRDVATPVLDATLEANALQLDRAFEMIAETGARRVGLLGLSFKPDTDDLRESPMVDLAEKLVGKGFDVRIFDPNVQLGKLTGANSSYVRARIPHLSTLLSEDVDEVIGHAETVVIYNRHEAERVANALEGKSVVDLVRFDAQRRSNGQYQGICW
jgi:GDP-mannose 6-dehydrogenase